MKYVDLFSGCGGLSLGIERAGGELLLAVEKSDMAARTFYHNLIGDASDAQEWARYVASGEAKQIASRLLVRELSVLLEDSAAMEEIRSSELDLVVGGPPCQGFSMAGRRNKDDIRNKLAWEYLTFVERTSPKMVVIENVVGMSRTFTEGEDSSFHQLRQALELNERGSHRYVVQGVLVNAMHFGAPQHRPRLMLIALREDIAGQLGVEATAEIWKSAFTDRTVMPHPDLSPIPTVDSENQLLLRDAISDLDSWPSHPTTRNNEYLKALRGFEHLVCNSGRRDGTKNHNRRRHSDRVVRRFSFYRMLLEHKVDQRLLSVIGQMDQDLALRHARVELNKVDLPVSIQMNSSGASQRVETIEELVALAWLLRTKKHSQRVLAPDAPSRTVVTLPDDYGHPIHPRTFTVRELARFQGFPDTFEFMGKETTGADRRRFEVPQYTQVGNAVSPWQSFAVGKRLKAILNRYEGVAKSPRILVDQDGLVAVGRSGTEGTLPDEALNAIGSVA